MATKSMLEDHRRALADKSGDAWILRWNADFENSAVGSKLPSASVFVATDPCLEPAAPDEDGATACSTVDEKLQECLNNGNIKFLFSSLQYRVQGYANKAAETGFLQKGAAFCNLIQKPNFFSLSDHAPALLRGSVLYDLVSGQEVLPIQHWLTMGAAVPAVAQPDSGVVCPFLETFFKELTDREARTLAGNAMHVAAIGTFLMFSMAATTKNF